MAEVILTQAPSPILWHNHSSSNKNAKHENYNSTDKSAGWSVPQPYILSFRFFTPLCCIPCIPFIEEASVYFIGMLVVSSCYHKLYLSMTFALLCMRSLFPCDMLFEMLVPGIECVTSLSVTTVISMLFYSLCQESNYPLGCDRGREERPWPLSPYASQNY